MTRAKSSEVLICEYPSRTSKYGVWRVVHDGEKFKLQWMAGAAYPPKVTKQTVVTKETARAHWTYAGKRGYRTKQYFDWKDFS
jgi:hypothetical protein